ncbi:MAG: hypothetical protein KGJ62_10840 [Armatimonadetes bacterium]|nr:hypothetical protein [Armatimonadota bacterium]
MRRLLVQRALAAGFGTILLAADIGLAAAQNSLSGANGSSFSTLLSGTPQHTLLRPATTGDVTGVAMPWLALPANRHTYPHPRLTQLALFRDPAVEAAFASPDFGAQLAASAQRTIAVIGLPVAPGEFGSFSMFSGPFALRKAAAARTAPAANAAAPAGAALPAPAPTSAAGLIRQIRVTPAQRLANARRVMIDRFDAWVTLDRDNKGVTLHVVGSLPPALNSNTPVNLTVEATQYDSSSNQGTGLQTPSASVLLDKELLPAAVDGGAQYFYASYPLTAPAPGTQTNLLIRYWGDPGVALTQAIAIARSSSRSPSSPRSWVAVPASRLQLYRLPIEYLVINRAQPGDALNYNQTLRQLGVAYVRLKAAQKKKPGT